MGGVIYWFRLGFRYAARWRDLWVYALAVYYRVFTRRPFYLVEETILNRHSGNRYKIRPAVCPSLMCDIFNWSFS